MNDILRPGTARHTCDFPRLDLRIRHHTIWRCACGRRWRLTVTQPGRRSWEGEWNRWYWPWPR